MKKFIVALLIAALPAFAQASGGAHLDHAPINIHDQGSLQRGAKLFVNYCLSCHSAKAMRYNRMGRDLGLTDEQVAANLMFASEKTGSLMTVAMPAQQAKVWFGKVPPDLSVITRSRTPDYIYTYLRGFYKDASRPTGYNNHVLANAGMPHVLWQMQETMAPGEYDMAVADLTNFMTYMAEPAALVRTKLGWWVLGFLVILFIVSYALKKEYWRDVH